MSLSKLLTLLILGTSSVALAHPVTVDRRDDSYSYARDRRDDAIVRDHRTDIAPLPPAPLQPSPPPTYDRDYNQPLRFRLRPMTLAHSVTLMRQRNRDQRPL